MSEPLPPNRPTPLYSPLFAEEEIVDNVRTGVEREFDDSEPDFRTPYDPKAIHVDPRVYSVRQILDMVEDAELDLAPDFQRMKVWKARQKSVLIESLLLRIPLPAFYFSSDKDGLLQVVDGVQRLTTIFDYVRNDAFALTGLEYLEDMVGGKRFSAIDNTIWSRRIMNTQITAFVIDPQTPTRVKFDIFRRINTGGSPLNSQEIRHCMSRPRSREYLRALANSEAFSLATRDAFINDVRMVARELALRFVAFRLVESVDLYMDYGSMDEFLTAINESIDNPLAVSDDELNELQNAFELGMENAIRVFGSHAFRKWPQYSDDMYPINRSLFDVWSVELSRIPARYIEERAAAIQAAARELMTKDYDFINAISAGTGTTAKVLTRFTKVQKLLSGPQ